MEAFDLLVVGAGPVGCVIAERAANVLGLRCLVLDRRPHLAGNCYDREHSSGVLVHEYGPHYFRTNSAALLDYLGRFSPFHEADYLVRASVAGKSYPLPINLTTLEQFFGIPSLTALEAARLLESKRVPIQSPRTSEELVLSTVGRELYEAFYLGYTQKQWGRHPRELDASVCGRLPIRLSRDERYVTHRFQVMPTLGFSQMFEAMLRHPLIEVRLKTDYAELRRALRPRFATVYTGPIDEYFGYRHGRLPWRSLAFDFRLVDAKWAQPSVQINYPNEHEFTRSVEIKHVTRQSHARTVVVDEYPQAGGEPYYPVPSPEGRLLYEKYKQLAVHETNREQVHFCGRLAEYKYINTDEAIESALALFETLRERHGRRHHGALT
jgi:UDP-galactopyranose mutase